jgi:hypothetical protein
MARVDPAGFWSRRTALLCLTLLGSLALANVVVRFWRLRAGSDSLDLLVLGTIALGIVVIWFLYFTHMRALDKLSDQSEKKVLARLSSAAYTMGFFAYMMVIEALLLMHPLPH